MNVLSSHNTSHSSWGNRTFACHASEVILAEGSTATSVTTGILISSDTRVVASLLQVHG